MYDKIHYKLKKKKLKKKKKKKKSGDAGTGMQYLINELFSL